MAEEIWDVYDVHRRRTGKTIVRQQAWGFEKYHLIVHVCLFNPAGQMLIQKRAHQKQAWADLWDVSAGGSALAGEDSYQAAEREVMEELGLPLNLRNIRPHLSINYERGFDDFYTVIRDLDLHRLILQPSEVSGIRWATLEEVRQMLQDREFVPYFPGLIDLIWQIRDNYDGAVSQKKTAAGGKPAADPWPAGLENC